MNVGIIIANGSGASVKYGPDDGLDGIRLSHIVDRIIKDHGFPESRGYEINKSYWPWSIREVKSAILHLYDWGVDRLFLTGFSKGAMRITDALNDFQAKADRGSKDHRRIIRKSAVLLVDYQRTIFNKHNARPRVFRAAVPWIRYFRQEGSKVNPGVRRTMNGYPMDLPNGRETVIKRKGVWHNNVRHTPEVGQGIVDGLRWCFNREEV